MNTVLINDIAKELGINKDYAKRVAKKMGFEIHYGKRRIASVSKSDYEKFIKDYEPRRPSTKQLADNTEFDGFGYYYIIQLEPIKIPDRVKVGYADSLIERCAQHRTTNPNLKVLKSWPCKRIWEKTAEASITRNECIHIGGEVYEGDLQLFLDRAETFFSLLPTVERK